MRYERGDVLVDEDGRPWCYHGPTSDSLPTLLVTWIWKEEEAGFASTHVYPHETQIRLPHEVRRASPLELLALAQAGYVLELE